MSAYSGCEMRSVVMNEVEGGAYATILAKKGSCWAHCIELAIVALHLTLWAQVVDI